MTTAIRRYSRGRRLVALREVQANQSRYYHFDQQGTTQCLSDGAGVVSDRFAADAWGVPVKRTGNSINLHWYVGNTGYSDQAGKGLNYVRRRYYSQSLAAWLSADPWRPRYGSPRFAYAANSPERYTDPTGMKPCCCCCPSELTFASQQNVSCQDGGASYIGHYFVLRAGLKYEVSKKAKVNSNCRLTWEEKSNYLYGGTMTWMTFFPRPDGKEVGGVVGCWERNAPACPDKKLINLHDLPYGVFCGTMNNGMRRPTTYRYWLRIRVTLEGSSDPVCRCSPAKRVMELEQIVDSVNCTPGNKNTLIVDGKPTSTLNPYGDWGRIDSCVALKQLTKEILDGTVCRRQY